MNVETTLCTPNQPVEVEDFAGDFERAGRDEPPTSHLLFVDLAALVVARDAPFFSMKSKRIRELSGVVVTDRKFIFYRTSHKSQTNVILVFIIRRA